MRPSTNWPREFRPQSEDLVFEVNPKEMEKHYKARINALEPLDKIFLNEINPAVHLLEHTALGIFPRKKLPIVKVNSGQPESIYFLMQGTLYNKTNEAVFQTWQIIEFQGGDSECQVFVDLTEPDHTSEVVETIRGFLDTSVNNSGYLDDEKQKRIRLLTPIAINWMKSLIGDARGKRSRELEEELQTELKRVRQWEKERRQFLNLIKSEDHKVTHAGHFAKLKRATEELKNMDRDSKNLRKYIEDKLMTSDFPDIRILSIFIPEI